MNHGLMPFPNQAKGPLLRAALLLDATALTVDGVGPTAGQHYGQAGVRSAANIARVLYNGTGDFTVFFQDPMPDNRFMVVATCRDAGATPHLITVSGSDTALTDRKRFSVVTRSGGAAANLTELHLLFYA